MENHQPVGPASEDFLDSRGFYLSISLLVGVLVIVMLSLALKEGSTAAKLILDMTGSDAQLPYPLTIQNGLIIFLALGVGEVLYRRAWIGRELRAMEARLLPENPQTVLTPEDVPMLRRKIVTAKAYAPGYIMTVIDQCLVYFETNRSPENTHQLLNSLVDLELHRADLRYSLLRYLAWLIPTIGFIGTVVGIAGALSFLDFADGARSSSQNMEPVVNALALAFNTTIMALIFSAILVFLMGGTQRKEEDVINSCSDYCLRNLVNRLYTP